MRKEEFCEVLGDINENYVKEARANCKARKPVWLKWGAMAACFCLVICVIAISQLFGDTDTPDPGAGDLAPMIYVNNSLYRCVGNQPDLTGKKSEFIYLGEIESKVDASQEPTENFQANDDIVGTKVYQYGEDIVVLIDSDYWLYSASTDQSLEF